MLFRSSPRSTLKTPQSPYVHYDANTAKSWRNTRIDCLCDVKNTDRDFEAYRPSHLLNDPNYHIPPENSAQIGPVAAEIAHFRFSSMYIREQRSHPRFYCLCAVKIPNRDFEAYRPSHLLNDPNSHIPPENIAQIGPIAAEIAHFRFLSYKIGRAHV